MTVPRPSYRSPWGTPSLREGGSRGRVDPVGAGPDYPGLLTLHAVWALENAEFSSMIG